MTTHNLQEIDYALPSEDEVEEAIDLTVAASSKRSEIGWHKCGCMVREPGELTVPIPTWTWL